MGYRENSEEDARRVLDRVLQTGTAADVLESRPTKMRGCTATIASLMTLGLFGNTHLNL